jgi:hypothetical protein
LLNDPVAQKLFQAPIPGHLAYVWTDGTPRVVPIWYHWTGSELVFGTPPTAPKSHALEDGDKVAVSIDTYEWPYKSMTIRGTAHVSIVDGIAPEYAAAAERCFGKEAGQGWVAQVSQMSPKMMRIAVTPEWVSIHDFEKRMPSAIEKAMEMMAGKSGNAHS